jgi:serine phosphatase RsbU (regulator of sigma subunit)
LALAHRIQKTLVLPVTLRSVPFDVYGIECPSDKVGGDLVDALHLSDRDAIAYLVDIAGHGLQAGILTGMLKTAARTALLEAGACEPHQTLPALLDRLNTVLPQVKEAHKGTGAAYLIELNPRCTQLGHLRLPGQGDLAGVLIPNSQAKIPPLSISRSRATPTPFFPRHSS